MQIIKTFVRGLLDPIVFFQKKTVFSMILLRNCLYFFCFTLLLSGCKSAKEEMPVPATPNTVDNTTTVSQGSRDTVEIAQMKFQPATLTVHKGDTVVFINKDGATPHNVAEESGAWVSPTLSNGDTYPLIVTGSVSYYCSIHPGMKGTITVQ